LKTFASVASLALILLPCGHALAVKEQIQITPANQQALGFAVISHQRNDGTVQFTITRDLSKARSHPADSTLETRRTATLSVHGNLGLIAQCNVEAMHKQQTLIYHFVIARERIAASNFSVAEIDDYKNRAEAEHLLGGGTFFNFRLGDFVAK
jgi:hypothetical protein